MDFLRKFDTTIQAIGAGVLKVPQVIYVKDVDKTLFSIYGIPDGSFVAVQEIDGQLTLEQINIDALIFTANSTSTISLTNYGGNTPNVLYSRDGITWTLWDYSSMSLQKGETLFMRGTNPLGFNKSLEVYSNFNISGDVELSGNIMSLLTGGATSSISVSQECCFYTLFRNCLGITKLDKNLLPATSVTGTYCYNAMFENTSITDAPELPATELGEGCYLHMFRNCGKLKTTPTILPATTLTTNCYAHMFRNCPLLTNTPILPATTLANYCYANMFRDCTSLTTAPELPATILKIYCYTYMFSGCTNLNYIKCLATNISAANCTSNWVNGVAATGTFTKAASMNDWTTGTSGIPEGWIIENEVEFVGLKFTSTGNSTVDMSKSSDSAPTVYLKYSLDNGKTWTQWDFSAISLSDGQSVCFKGLNTTFATGTSVYNKFVMTGSIAASGNIMSIIDDGACTTTTIPAKDCFYRLFYNCKLTTAPELPATTLAEDCYSDMFFGCTSLTTAPELPATTLQSNCYSNMFRGCTSLTIAPALPATTSTIYCYSGMFRDCTSLTTAPELPATTLAFGCYNSMFWGCTSLTTAPELPATTLENSCYQSMFNRCSSLNSIKCIATDISAANCTSNWVNSVAATGTFVKNASITSWTTGVNGIPSDWTVQNAA